ncbi:MAG TPA: NAD-dependent epimerase/dehydratase family protein [Solirubrobacteraceae bacterium]|nr:NAD-dependent epimerase/dehydratase family protein [Solirubrobacteraceae bacterium]
MDGAFVTGGSGFVGGRLIGRLVGDGVRVRALARSDRAAERVREAGAEPVRGDLDDAGALRRGIAGCEVVFHAAAKVEDWGDPRDFERVNVQGTRNVLAAAREAGARRLVHVGTEAALLAGRPLVGADESAPLRPDSPVLYSSSKARAEMEVVTAPPGLEAVVVRPRFVWGAGDTTLLPQIVAQMRSGQWAWVGGGRHRTATTHVDNTVEGLVLAATRGRDRGVWFVTDGGSVVFRDFLTELARTQGVEPPDRSIPAPVARGAAIAAEALWRALRLPGHPPLTRFASWVASDECTISIARAREELGYAPVRTREEGLAELRSAA